MGLVAGPARGAVRVLFRDHLRESLWLGAVGFVTDDAEFRCVRKRGGLARKVQRMFSSGTMTAFTGHICVRTPALRLGDICMAGRARLVTGEHGSPRGYFMQ